MTINERSKVPAKAGPVVDPGYLFNKGENYQAYRYLGAHREGEG